jgi:hypothetical protein
MRVSLLLRNEGFSKNHKTCVMDFQVFGPFQRVRNGHLKEFSIYMDLL